MLLTRKMKIKIGIAAAAGLFVVMVVAIIFFSGEKVECVEPYKAIGGLCCLDQDDDGGCDHIQVLDSEIALVTVIADNLDARLLLGDDENSSAVRYVTVFNSNNESIFLSIGCEGYELAKKYHVACSPWIDQPDGVSPLFEVGAMSRESFAISLAASSGGVGAVAGKYETDVRAVLKKVGLREADTVVGEFPVKITVE